MGVPAFSIRGGGRLTAGAAGGPAISFLIVDDDPECASELAELLACMGYQARTAHTLAEALAVCAVEPIDFALVDLQLGAESGLDLIKGWRAAEARVPQAVLLSGRDLTNGEVASLGPPIPPRLSKPLDLARLETMIDELQNNRETGQT